MAKKLQSLVMVILFFAAIFSISLLHRMKQENATDKLGTLRYPSVLTIYFPSDSGQLVPAVRSVGYSADPTFKAEAALRFLMEGPTELEKKDGLSSAMPACALLGCKYQRPFIYLNFNAGLEKIKPGQEETVLRQLLFTLTSLRGVKGVVLQINGRRTGVAGYPFTRKGLIFRALVPFPGDPVLAGCGPADYLDLFIASIPEREAMWALMGPKARKTYRSSTLLETSAFAEGLGAWRGYRMVEEKITGKTAGVVIKGSPVLEGRLEKDKVYRALMVEDGGVWKWELP